MKGVSQVFTKSWKKVWLWFRSAVLKEMEHDKTGKERRKAISANSPSWGELWGSNNNKGLLLLFSSWLGCWWWWWFHCKSALEIPPNELLKGMVRETPRGMFIRNNSSRSMFCALINYNFFNSHNSVGWRNYNSTSSSSIDRVRLLQATTDPHLVNFWVLGILAINQQSLGKCLVLVSSDENIEIGSLIANVNFMSKILFIYSFDFPYPGQDTN